ncbi:MAG: hypothetical protein NVS4B2_30720 [Chloroflexota bacterium]
MDQRSWPDVPRRSTSPASLGDVLAAHPDALWAAGTEQYDLRSTAELLSNCSTRGLARPVVRLGSAFYPADDVPSAQSKPLVVLVETWTTDNSLAGALSHLDYGQWLDRAGVRWSSRRLLERLTLFQLATPVDEVALCCDGDERLGLRAGEEYLFVHIDTADSSQFCSRLLDLMGPVRPSETAQSHVDRGSPYWPPAPELAAGNRVLATSVVSSVESLFASTVD